MTITLPLPPTANHRLTALVIKGRARMVESAECRRYKTEVAWRCRAAGLSPLSGPVRIRLDVYFPTEAGDLFNREKVLCDALQGWTYEDDRQIHAAQMARHVDRKNPRVEVEVTPL